VLREPPFLLFREDQLSVGNDVELALLTRDGLGFVGGALVQLGRETRSPAVIAVSDGAVEDLDLHVDEPIAALGCYLLGMFSSEAIDARLDGLARRRFRSKFHLRGRERALVQLRGEETIRKQAAEFVAKRLAPAAPHKDGKQTPYRGHPAFVAQHATATCCRSCLLRAHEIPKGRELTAEEQRFVVDVIWRWIERELG
jgi:hypothetical protein